MMRRVRLVTLRALACIVLSAACLVAQESDDSHREATVGMRAKIMQLVVEGSELVPAPSTSESVLVVRVLATWPHGDHLRYDLEWVGFEEGTYDLTKFLVRKDGSSMDNLSPVEVNVLSVLPGDAFEPSELERSPATRLDGYTTTQIVTGVFWGVGLLSILFIGRKWKKKALPAPPKPTLADRLRPMVERVASGNADAAQKAELERLLVAFWRARLDLGSVRAMDAIVTIRNHKEAGALLRQVEAWLHAPEPPAKFDVAGLLRPYRAVTADSLAVTSAALGGGN